METKKQFVLTRKNEQGQKLEEKIVTTADEAVNALYGGFTTETFTAACALDDYFKIKTYKIQKETGQKKLRDKFSQQDRNLIYLQGGIDAWFEDVNNYWWNRRKYSEEYDKEYDPFGSKTFRLSHEKKVEREALDLEGQLYSIMAVTHSQLFHTILLKDMAAGIESLIRTNKSIQEHPELQGQSFGYDVESLMDLVASEFRYRGGERVHSPGAGWEDGNIPERLKPRDADVRDYHPLLEPFKEELERLEADGVTELPDWLKHQGEMAALSAIYQNTPLHMREWIAKTSKVVDAYRIFVEEKKIADAPEMDFYFQNFAEHLEVIDPLIHRR